MSHLQQGASQRTTSQGAYHPRVTTPTLCLVAQRRQAGNTNPSHSLPREASQSGNAPHSSPSLPRRVLLHHRVADGRTKIRSNTASITGTNDATQHEDLRAVKWMLLPPHRTCASSLRLTCVVHVERTSVPQPYFKKCPRVLSSPGSSVSISLSRSTDTLLSPKIISSSARLLQRKHGLLTLLDPSSRRGQKDHTQGDTQEFAWERRRTRDQPTTKETAHRKNLARDVLALTRRVTQFQEVRTPCSGIVINERF